MRFTFLLLLLERVASKPNGGGGGGSSGGARTKGDAPLATADTRSPICAAPGAEPVRVACFGDSLTAGEGGFVSSSETAGRSRGDGKPLSCRLGRDSDFCRGSYPRVLAGLLGPRFEVRAFAQSGLPLTMLLPSACIVPGNATRPDGTVSEVVPDEVVPHAAPHTASAAEVAAVARCHEAFDLPPALAPLARAGQNDRERWSGGGRHPLLHAVMASRPHVVLLLLGTNDAGAPSHGYYARPAMAWTLQPAQKTLHRAVHIWTMPMRPACTLDVACTHAAHTAHTAHLTTGTIGENTYGRYGETGPPTALAHVVAALVRSATAPSASPLVYVLDPPLLLAEQSANRRAPCAQMKQCAYHPRLPCWLVAECVTCVAGDRVVEGGYGGDRVPRGQKERPWQPAEAAGRGQVHSGRCAPRHSAPAGRGRSRRRKGPAAA